MLHEPASRALRGLVVNRSECLRRELVGIVGVEVIQEGEERPLRLPASGQPVEELAVDRRRVFPVVLDEPPEGLPGVLQEVEIQPTFEETPDRLDPGHRPLTRTAILAAVSRGKM